MQFNEDDSFLCKIRITLDKIKKNHDAENILGKIKQQINKSLPYLFTQETGKNGSIHYHGILYTEHPEWVSAILKDSIQSRGFSCNMYDSDNNRIPEYYFGYILKEDPPNIIMQNIEYENKINDWKKYHQQQNVKTSEDCLEYVKNNYGPEPYEDNKLLQVITDYYKDTKKVYDKYIILRRSFHMCRLALFEDIERKNLTESLHKIIDG